MSKIALEEDIKLTSSTPDDDRIKKKWGSISALPSEYLIHFRHGKIQEKTSGQGGSCFKLLGDTVFIVPTSLKEIVFEANQLTKDNVDVKIRGMAVYRIYDPMKIFKLINFSHRQSAEEKLARMIGDMCRSTAKWLVANMAVEECIRKRKEEIAAALKQETSLIVNHTETGWGVEIVTIDIQDVYIQDTEIFKAMQMRFKTEKINESKLAQMQMERNLEINQLEKESELAEHKKKTEINKARLDIEMQNEQLELEKDLEIKKLEHEQALSEYQKQHEIKILQNNAIIETEKLKTAKQQSAQQFELDQYQLQKQEELEEYKFQQEIERKKQNLLFILEQTEKEVAAEKLKHHEEIEALEKRIAAENTISPVLLEKLFIEKALPEMAIAMAKHLKDAKIYMSQDNPMPFSLILDEVLDIFKQKIKSN